MDDQYQFSPNWTDTSYYENDPTLAFGFAETGSTRPIHLPRLDTSNFESQRPLRRSLGSLTIPVSNNNLLSPSWQMSPIYNLDVHEDPWDSQRGRRTTALDQTVPRHTPNMDEYFQDSGFASASAHEKQSVVSAPVANYMHTTERRTRRPGYQRNFPPASGLRRLSDTASASSDLSPCAVCWHENRKRRIPKNQADKKKHELTHTRPFKCDVPGCSKARGFSTLNDLERHKKGCHGIAPKHGSNHYFKCVVPNCPKAERLWDRKDNFKQHIHRIHRGLSAAEQEGCLQRSRITPSAEQLERFYAGKTGSRGAKTEDQSEYGMSAVEESSAGNPEPLVESFAIPQAGYEEPVWSTSGFDMTNSLGSAYTTFDMSSTSPLDTNLDPCFFDNNVNVLNGGAIHPCSYAMQQTSLPSSFTAGLEGLDIEESFGLDNFDPMSGNNPALMDMSSHDYLGDFQYTHDSG